MPEVDEPIILLAEDNEDDVIMFCRAFKDVGYRSALQLVRHGDEVVAYLSGAGKFANRAEYPLPTLLLLDLKMPRKNGFEVLEWIRGQPGLRRMLVIVLTTSERIEDINRAYQLGANSFLSKPLDFGEFRLMLNSLHQYWTTFNRAPSTERLREGRPSNGTSPK